MEEKYKAFSEFNWSDERWQEYLSGLYPPPNYKQVTKFKKKWYKKQVDAEFDIEYNPDASSSSTASASGGSSGPTSTFQSSDGAAW